ncbi:hypothetical protein FNYG_13287 [Fusarium nygamai]|uniref:Xylanolytic transcriptional activator regulatory domain-containing protein n=1 Tax=Gibberella nygamai TaxID=42673 RepID=A0A2K0VTP2_GIBNY|nr:hypothetical protein FNYG_13287 [Fusarium nygamai]
MAIVDALALQQGIAKFLNQESLESQLEDSQSGSAGNLYAFIDKSNNANHETEISFTRDQAARISQLGTQGPTPASTHESNSGGPDRPQTVPKPSDWVFQGTFARTASLEERKPPLDLVLSSTSVFFRHIHPWFPFLDTQLVLNDLADLREPTLLYYAIFGASIPFLYDPRLNNTQSDSFWKYTKRRIFIETSEEPSYAAPEAATILTLDLSGMTNGPQVWSRLAVVARLAAQLRTASGKVLRQSVPGGSRDDRLVTARPSAQQRARLFWAIYALDSFISITTSQPALLTEHILRTFRPTREATWLHEPSHSSVSPPASYNTSEPATYSASAAFLKLLQLLDVSRSYHDLYLSFILLPADDDSRAISWLESFHSLCDAANTCLEGLPPWCRLPLNTHATASYTNHNLYTRTAERLASTPRIHDIQAPVIMVHAYGHALTIYINGLLEFSNHQILASHDAGVRQNATVRCENSARVIIDIASTFVKTHGDRMGWPFAWSAWTAARYLLTLAKAAGSPQLSPGFYTLLDSLQDLGKYWQISKKYWWLLYRASESLVTTDVNTHGLAAPTREDFPRRAGETHPPISLCEKPGNAQRILEIITDLRVPTSDVEDQFRVDPVFSVPSTSEGSATGADCSSSPTERQREPCWQTEGVVTSDDGPFFNEFTYSESLYMSDLWFNTPLFATSGYQQFCEDGNHT